MTIQSQLIDGLITLGWIEGRPTTHYRAFSHATQRGTMYVGRSGALRFSITNKVTHCQPVGPKYREKVLAAPLTALFMA